MHITLVISSLNPGGAERVMSELANDWASAGHKVTLLTLMPPDTKPFYHLDPKIQLIQLDLILNKASFLLCVRDIVKRVFILRKTFQKLNPNIIISFIDVMNITTLLTSVGLKIPVIVSERIDPHFHPIFLPCTIIRPLIYRRAHKIVVQTKNAASYFSHNLQQLINIIPNPVKFKSCKVKIRSSIQFIVSVGRLDKQKNHDILIRAFANIHDLYTDLRLIIYGEGVERENLEKLIESLHLQQKVFLPGITRDIDQALLQADLFVFPSQYEGFPNALCEAMAIGLPVIASDCSGNVDIVRDCVDGRLFPVGDMNRLTELLQELVNDTEQRKRLGSQAQEITERFSHKHIFKMWDEVIEKIII